MATKARIVVQDSKTKETLTGDWLEVSNAMTVKAHDVLWERIADVLKGETDYLSIRKGGNSWVVPRRYLVENCVIVIEND